MNWKQIATITLGGAMIAAGALMPALAMLVPIGTGVIGIALPQVFRGPPKAKS